MSEKRGVPKPNYTGIPNILFDIMPKMGEAELRVTLAICRQTFGWHKKSDRISLRQMQKLTGLSRPAITAAIKQGEERGLIKRRAVKQGDPEKGYYFSLVVIEDDHLEEGEWLTEFTTSGKAGLPPKTPEVVKQVYQQKKEDLKETKQKKTTPANGTRAAAEHQQVIDSYVKELGYTPPNMGREAKAAKWLVTNHYNPDQVVECYRHLKRDKYWRDKFVSLQKVAEQIAEVAGRSNGSAPTTYQPPTQAEIDAARSAPTLEI